MNNKELKVFGKDISDVLWEIVKDVLLVLFVFICVYPFYYVIIYSLSDPQLASRGVYFWPRGFTLQNFKEVLGLGDLGHAFLVSVTRTVLGTLVTVLCTTLLAYQVTKDFWGRKVCYRFIIITMYTGGGLIPWYLVMTAYGFTNSFLAYIVPGAVAAGNMILVKTFIEQLPASLEESAAIEGAGFYTTFFKIIIPLSKPIIATIAVYRMVSQWNSWKDNYFLNSKKSLMTMQLVLRNYLTQAQKLANMMADENNIMAEDLLLQSTVTPESVRMTAVVVTMLPIMLVYPFAQKYFTKGIMMGAVKG
ncbi:MAG: carbohydrate ABC transporter permease [Lachnospiraceae bacterium]|nr:carbohydrate ABC transporter permease [Lachnospiraceae bacterium]